jgi:APA family basic amino acid/polyamine antiporter
MWVTFAAGYSAVYQAMVVVLLGVILYAFLKARRERDGRVAAPVEASPIEASPGTKGAAR